MARELRQSRGYPNSTFQGESEELSFASVVYGKVFNLTYDYKSQGLWRHAKVLSAPWDAGEEREAVPGIADIEFTYYGYDGASSSYIFFDEWDGAAKGLPMAVRVMVDLEDETHLEKIMHVPTML